MPGFFQEEVDEKTSQDVSDLLYHDTVTSLRCDSPKRDWPDISSMLQASGAWATNTFPF